MDGRGKKMSGKDCIEEQIIGKFRFSNVPSPYK
jgi:hypothetical protein